MHGPRYRGPRTIVSAKPSRQEEAPARGEGRGFVGFQVGGTRMGRDEPPDAAYRVHRQFNSTSWEVGEFRRRRFALEIFSPGSVEIKTVNKTRGAR